LQSFILTISCKDKPGIVAKVTKFLFDNGFNILESGQFNDKDTNNFFMRTEFHKQENNLFLNHEELIKLKSDFDVKIKEICGAKDKYNILEKKIEVLDIDETPAYGLETKVQLGINGVVECI